MNKQKLKCNKCNKEILVSYDNRCSCGGELLEMKQKIPKEFIDELKSIDNCVEVKNKDGEIYFAVPFEIIDNLTKEWGVEE